MSPAPHTFHPSILREYDIRGIVGETLFVEDAWAIGLAFAKAVRAEGGRTVAVGRDGRLSSPELAEALISGLIDGGMEVWDIGLGPTPMLYYAAKVLGAHGGVQITGSHNPPSHNGFKMVFDGKPFFAQQIQDLGKTAKSASWDVPDQPGSRQERPVFDDYVARLEQDFVAGPEAMKVVWDAGNAAAGEAMVALTAKLPGEHILMNQAIDGTFPAHHPDPTDPQTLEQLRAKVAEVGADCGLAFDGDGDRIGVIDGEGEILWGDQILQILAEPVLKAEPGAVIMADVKASQALFDVIAELGGEPLMWRTGHSLIKTKMAETKAPLAGEMSGHIFFSDTYYGFDDALYAAVRFLSAIGGLTGETVAQRRARMPKLVNTPELRFDCPDERKFAVIQEVKDRLAADPEAGEVNDIDGVRVLTEDGWWLLRASNTQAVLVARCEARTQEGLDRLSALLTAQVEASGLKADFLSH